jgi:hypothetical protein
MSDPARSHRAIARLARVAACAGAILVTAAEPPAGTPPAAASRDSYRDLQLSVHSRRAICDDETLAELNIGVRVRDGVATLWGPVPSADVIPKAVKRVEGVQGVLGVRTELYVVVPEKKIEPLLQDLEKPMLSESASPNPESGSISPLTGRDEKASVVYPASGPRSPFPGVELGGPVPLPATATQPPAPNRKETPAAPPAPPRKEDLAAALLRVRGSDPRFRTLRAELRGATVIISGNDERAGDVMAMARVVSRLPGVERVVTKSDAASAP